MYISLNTKTHDSEYQQIIRQLLALGLTPSGNKSSDKARLQIEKDKLVNKIAEQNQPKENFIETLIQVNEENSLRQTLEEERLGAMSIAELNKYYFGL